MADDDEHDGWSTVHYRRGRMRRRDNAPPPPRCSSYPRRNQQAGGYRRSYASWSGTRLGPTLHLLKMHNTTVILTAHHSGLSHSPTKTPNGLNVTSASKGEEQVMTLGQTYSPQRRAPTQRPGSRQHPASRTDRQRDITLSDDPDFTLKVRILYKLIKAVHHLQTPPLKG
ncbi:Hypothetical predicted protein [Scomber scombrus]|uniref:Uncharacterized protein n=1 Tax=Scomber scombrus TaxID=13677 RepID=A0AAV1QGT4_SCOSC